MLVSSGMRDLGYNWVVLDDCWHPSRDANGTLVPFERFFPHGMKATIDYVHSQNISFGLYTSVGDETCHGGWSPGSYGHYQTDADTFAGWGVDYVKMDYCGDDDSPAGHKNFSKALNNTGRPMVFALCRGPYQQQEKWGYAPDVAQVWRATGDHHDVFSSVLQQLNAVKGRSSWSSPGNWAYLDMIMTGGEGCKEQCTGSKNDTGVCDFKTPKHCPGQTDNEYRTEASLYTVVSSPIMVGTDIRLMTPIMKELLLNPESIAINQDADAVPGDAMMGCGPAPAPPTPPPAPKPAKCTVSLKNQISRHGCRLGKTFGCSSTDTSEMWVSGGCRGTFECNGNLVDCGKDGAAGSNSCKCTAAPSAPGTEGEVWVRYLSDGDVAVAMPNLGSAPANVSICLDAIGWKHGATAKARDVWKKKDLEAGSFTGGKFTAMVGVHDTLLLRLSPSH